MGAMANFEKYGLESLQKVRVFPNDINFYSRRPGDYAYDENAECWTDALRISLTKPVEIITFDDFAKDLGFGSRIDKIDGDAAYGSFYRGNKEVLILNGATITCKNDPKIKNDILKLIKNYGEKILGWKSDDLYLNLILQKMM